MNLSGLKSVKLWNISVFRMILTTVWMSVFWVSLFEKYPSSL